MTKRRPALSYAEAITRIADAIGWAECARLTGRAERTVRLWSEADIGGICTMDRARDLDVAYRAAGGQGTPMLDAYAAQVDAQLASVMACHAALAADLAAAAREAGDAISAGVIAAQPGASEREVQRAIAEGADAVGAITALMRRLRGFLPKAQGGIS